MKPTCISSAGLPLSLLTVRPTSGTRIGPAFSHKTEYWCAKTYLLFWSRFIKIYLYYVTIMAKCTCAWLHQLLKLTSAIFGHVLIQVKQDGFMLRLICIFLGCDLPIQLLLKSLSSTYHDRLVDHFHSVLIHVMNYKLCNILYLNK